MGQSLESLLHHETISKVIAAVKAEKVDGRILPKEFFRVTAKCRGNEAYLLSQYASRKVAQACAFGAPSKQVALGKVTKTPVTLLHTFEHFTHSPVLLQNLMSQNETEQDMASEIVGAKVRDAGQRQINLRTAAWYSLLVNGKIWLDNDGNLLPTEVGAVITIDYGVPAGNRGHLDWDGNGDIISASWATAGTDISAQLMALKKAAVAQCGYPITTAYFGQNIPGYLAGNDIMKEFLTNSEKAVNAMMAGDIPDGFLKMRWVNATEAMYEDNDGNAQFFFGGDTVVFTPDVKDDNWWGFVEGSYPVPVDIGGVDSDMVNTIRGGLKSIFGMFSYCLVQPDPVTVIQYFGDTMLPILGVPKSIYIADVVV